MIKKVESLDRNQGSGKLLSSEMIELKVTKRKKKEKKNGKTENKNMGNADTTSDKHSLGSKCSNGCVCWNDEF
jgi:hypothetical protein